MTIILSIVIIASFLFYFSTFIYYRKKYNSLVISVKAKNKNRKQLLIPYFINQIESATTLNEVFNLHKMIWLSGIKHPYFGPNEYGMFRTKNITTMTKDEVYLGNTWGLFTKSLSFWEQSSDEDARNIVLRQYKSQLLLNLKDYESNVLNNPKN